MTPRLIDRPRPQPSPSALVLEGIEDIVTDALINAGALIGDFNYQLFSFDSDLDVDIGIGWAGGDGVEQQIDQGLL